ncbi:uncharacterized protein MYCGRDRAFT_103102, partial [Zymoseptoria tritici IPO323]
MPAWSVCDQSAAETLTLKVSLVFRGDSRSYNLLHPPVHQEHPIERFCTPSKIHPRQFSLHAELHKDVDQDKTSQRHEA